MQSTTYTPAMTRVPQLKRPAQMVTAAVNATGQIFQEAGFELTPELLKQIQEFAPDIQLQVLAYFMELRGTSSSIVSLLQQQNLLTMKGELVLRSYGERQLPQLPFYQLLKKISDMNYQRDNYVDEPTLLKGVACVRCKKETVISSIPTVPTGDEAPITIYQCISCFETWRRR